MTAIRTDVELASEPLGVERIGGKAAGLVRLRALGAPVPRFAVVTTAAWRALSDDDTPPAAVPDDVALDLAAAAATVGPGPYAVRSSAVVEDSADASWAGQFESVLGVDAAGLAPAVLTCWRSAAGDRARAYAEVHGLRAGPVAVVVQQLVDGDVSGVMFSRDPEDPDSTLISAGLGLCEGVVQGTVPCDTFRVSASGEVTVELDDKDEEIVFDGEVTRARPVGGDRRTSPALSDDLARTCAEWGRRLEDDLGTPVDVEWTVAGGALHLLQVRPITVPIPIGRRLLWDNSNIVESYSGITTPLTFSFASAVYTIVYQLFCRVMGVDEATIRRNQPTFRRMLGLFRGRIFYNLNAWYRVLSLLPGFQFNRHAMETMMGVAEVASDEDAGPPRARWREGLSLGRLLARLGWRLLRVEADARRFQATFDATLERCRAVDFDRLRADELLALYEDIEERLLWGWTPPLVNDFFCMIFYKLLQKRCQELTGDDDTQLHNRLLAGEGLASAAPATDLMALAEHVRAAAALRDAVAAGDLDAALGDPGFREQWCRWMDRFGDRSPDELKLESPTLRDTPEFVLQTVAAWSRDDASVRPFGDRERDTREAAEIEARRLQTRFFRRRTFGFVLRQARRRVAMRESLRFERTRIFGVVRRIFRAFGDRFTETGHLDARDDVFLLTVDEILGFVRGTTATTDLRGLVAVRRAELERHRADPAPSNRFYTWGAAHLHNRFHRRDPVAVDPDAGEIAGTPCSPGEVVAPAAVVIDPRARPDLRGGILVAHRTDPGWVPLFPTASGVLVERGSLLSHSAVVARELGLPAIVGVAGLLDWARDGETIGMDGSSGRVWREGGESG